MEMQTMGGAGTEDPQELEMQDTSEKKDSPVGINNTSGQQKYSQSDIRNIVTFWFLGLGGIDLYILSFAAAADALADDKKFDPSVAPTAANETSSSIDEYLQCNYFGTGAVLLCVTIPLLVVKVLSPFAFMKIPYWIRWAVIVVTAALGVLLMGLGDSVGVRLVGPALGGLSSGLSDATGLAFCSHFTRATITSYSSGTGVVSPLTSLSYTIMRQVGVSYQTSVLVHLIFPLLLALIYVFLLDPPSYLGEDKLHPCKVTLTEKEEKSMLLSSENPLEGLKSGSSRLSFRDKLQVIKKLPRYMIPLSLVYFAEYYINQALLELLYFNNAYFGDTKLNRFDQYRWYMSAYFISVCISRSFATCVRIRWLWIFPILQIINMTLLVFQVIFQFIPSFWIVLVIVLWEGLLGGTTFLQTYHKTSEDMPDEEREFSLGIVSASEGFGLFAAGICAYYSHDRFCDMGIVLRS